MKLGKFLVGLGVGTVIGLLIAPKKGSELREDIKRESLKTYDALKNLTKEDVEAMLGQTIEVIKKTVDEFDMDEFKDSATTKLAELEEQLEAFATQVRESDQYAAVSANVADLTSKVNAKVEEVKAKVKKSEFTKKDLVELEEEIDTVEEKLEEIIEEITE